jgi:hypothetical protein
MEAVSSFAHPETASLLESAYSDYQIGAFENFHQLVEDALIVLGPRLQYELRFANRMKSQLLISHRFLLIKHKCRAEKKKEKSSHLLRISLFFWDYPINFCFNMNWECGKAQLLLSRLESATRIGNPGRDYRVRTPKALRHFKRC